MVTEAESRKSEAQETINPMETRNTRSSLAAAKKSRNSVHEESPGPVRTPRKSSRAKTPLVIKKTLEDPVDAPKSIALGSPRRTRRLTSVTGEPSPDRLTRSRKSVKPEEGKTVETAGPQTPRIRRVSAKSEDGEATNHTALSPAGSPRKKSRSPEKTPPAPTQNLRVTGKPSNSSRKTSSGGESVEPSSLNRAETPARRSPEKTKTRRVSEKSSGQPEASDVPGNVLPFVSDTAAPTASPTMLGNHSPRRRRRTEEPSWKSSVDRKPSETPMDEGSSGKPMEVSDEDRQAPVSSSKKGVTGNVHQFSSPSPGGLRTRKPSKKSPALKSGKLVVGVSSDEERVSEVSQLTSSGPRQRKSKEFVGSVDSTVETQREASPEKALRDQQVSDLSASIAEVSLNSKNGNKSKRKNHRKEAKRSASFRSSPDRQSEDLRTKGVAAKAADPSEVTVRRRGGGTIIETRPVFSDDAKYVYLNCGWGVRVFSVETGECVRVFDAFSKDYKVVNCFCWNSLPAALTSEGVFFAWDPRSGKIQHKVRMRVRVTEMVLDGFFIPCEDSAPLLCLVIESKDYASLRMYSGSNFRSLSGHPLSARKVVQPYKQHSFSVGGGPKHPFIAYIESKKGIRVVTLLNKTFFKNSNPPDKYWTCIRAHPAEDTIAVGDNIGRIVVFRNLQSSRPGKSHSVNSVYHWHTLPVAEIAFTPAGSSMYSGGGELTLVKWNVENPQVRHFLPRLSADIVHIAISPYNQMVAVATRDNGVQIVTPTNKLQCILQQFSWSVIATEEERMFPSGLLYDPRSRGLILNSRPGHLQLYSPHSETLTYNIDVTMMNYLTQERNKVIVNTQVTHSALTSDGLWLATVETRYEPGLALELRLKFWNYSAAKKRFILATVIDMPHDDQVHTIKFSPEPTNRTSNDSTAPDSEVVLVSTGADRKMRLWSKRPMDSIYHNGETWRCQNACFYRDLPCGPCSFSYDGSVLAVGFGAAVTLWDVDNVVLKHSLARSNEHIRFVEFGRDECCNMLMCATESTVMAWDLLKLVLSWKVNLESALFVADPFSSFLAVFTVGNQWKILDALSGEVVFTLNSEWKSEASDRPQKQQVLAAVFVPRHRPNAEAPKWMRNSYLYYIDHYQELNCLEPANEIAQLPKFQLALDKDSGTLFGSLVGAKSIREKPDEETKKSVGYGVLGARAVTQILGPAAHTLPPVNLLCASFLQSFVILKRDNPDESDRDDKSEDDKTTVVASSDSEQEVEMPTVPASSHPPKTNKTRSRRPPSGAPSEITPEPMEVDSLDLKSRFPMLDDDEDESWRRKLQEEKTPERIFIIDE